MSSPHADSSPDLSAWRIDPARDPEFRSRVWARIAEEQRNAFTFRAYLRAHARPIVTALTLAAIAGAWSGLSEGRSRAAADRATLVTVYVRELDARTMRHP